MSAPAAARAEVVVAASPDDAFDLLTGEIGLWWRRNTRFWNDAERGQSIRIEPYVGGRFVEVYDTDTGDGFEVGRVTAWEPGRRLAFTWTQLGWPEDAFTDIQITFEAADGGTRVSLEQTGFERVGADADEFRAGYEGGWRTVLGWFAEHIGGRPG